MDKVTLKEYCQECASSPHTSSSRVYNDFLSALRPLDVGDRVECFQCGDTDRYVGSGTISYITTDYREGGTEVNPVYGIIHDDGTHRRYTSICLKGSTSGK